MDDSKPNKWFYVALVGIAIIGGLFIATIANGDKDKQTQSKATVAEEKPEKTKPYTSFGEGLYEVGVDIQPGKYKSEGPTDKDALPTCYYARLSSLTKTQDPRNYVISDAGFDGPATVVIEPTDKGFETKGCNWAIVT